MKKVANRRGSNIRLYKYSDESLFMYIPFARITAPEVSSNRVWAQGGVSDANLVGFDDPATGTFKITTQIIPLELIALACTPNGLTTGSDWAVREEIVAAAAGSLTLSAAPIAGSLYVYAKSSDAEGTPVAGSVAGTTFTATTAGDIAKDSTYVAYYLKTENTAKKVTFTNRVTPGSFIIISDTEYKADDDTIVAEQITCHHAMPAKAISLSYQGSGDPASLEMSFDLTEDDNGDVITFARLGQ